MNPEQLQSLAVLALAMVPVALLWLLSLRPDVATVEASPAEPSQVHLEQCFQRESAGR